MADQPVQSSSDMRHCISDSNLLKLEDEAQMSWMKPSNAGSEALLTTIGDFANDVFCSLPSANKDPRNPNVANQQYPNMFDIEDNPAPAPVLTLLPLVPEQAKPVLQLPMDTEQQRPNDRRLRSSTDWQGSESKLLPVVMETNDLPSSTVERNPGNVTRRPPKDKGMYISRYRPGIPVLKGPYRDSIIQVELQKKEDDFCNWNTIRLGCNVLTPMSCAHLHITYTHIHAHNTTHTHTHAHAHICMRTHTYTHTCTHTCTHTYVHTCMHTHIHACTHTLTHAPQ